MKWKTPQLGDIRERRRFLLFPEDCDDGYTHWLEWVYVTEQYNMAYNSVEWFPVKTSLLPKRG